MMDDRVVMKGVTVEVSWIRYPNAYMKRTGIKRMGRVGEANRKSRKIIAEISEEKGLNFCEIRFDECLGGSFLAPAHRHLRAWYQGDVELLSDYDQWLCACVNCHTTLDSRSQTSQEESDAIFNRLRP